MDPSGWLNAEFCRARGRRFIDAIDRAKQELEALPADRREELTRRFDEAQELARRHTKYQNYTITEAEKSRARLSESHDY